MNRVLDLNTLRSFVAIVDSGGMTPAANKLHMTQSAISMQIKRLEASLGTQVLERSKRQVRPSIEGEQLLSYARRMLQLNDEALGRLTGPQFEGTISLGVPGDVIHPHMPAVLRQFNHACPRARLKLTTGLTVDLIEAQEKGHHDLILTTLLEKPRNAEILASEALVWTGARGGRAYLQTPVPVGFTRGCNFRTPAIEALNAAGINWVDTVDTLDFDSALVSVAADMAVTVEMQTFTHSALERINDPDRLPALPVTHIAMVGAQNTDNELVNVLARFIREAFLGVPELTAA
jgi:DNA-binding transcriptional LysR family regulator